MNRHSFEKAFELAHFLVEERSRALDVVCGAFEKLETQSFQEYRRFYWRDKHPTRPLRRVSRNTGDTLQWLVMMEAEALDPQFLTASQSAGLLAIRYIQYLLCLSTAMSSFYVNIAVARLLYAYTTGETQSTYEFLSHRSLGQDEYRRVKGVLMRRVIERFGGLLRTERGEHGELRFEAVANQAHWHKLVDECLSRLTPWSTDGSCTTFSKIGTSGFEHLDQNEAELLRYHLFIEPFCRSNLMKKLALETPEQRLSLPKFFVDQNGNSGSHDREEGKPAPLSAEEQQSLEKRLHVAKSRRRKANSASFRIMLDGVERARFSGDKGHSISFEIWEGLRILEVRGDDQAGEMLLGTHLVAYSDSGFLADSNSFAVNQGTIVLNIVPAGDDADVKTASVTVSFTQRSQSTVLRFLQMASWPQTARYALTAVIMFALGGFTILQISRLAERHFKDHALVKSNNSPAPSFLLVADDSVMRAQGSPRPSTVSLRGNPLLINLQLQMPGGSQHASYVIELSTFRDDKKIATYSALGTGTEGGQSALTVPIPTTLLERGSYYVLRVSPFESQQKLVESASFTFYVAFDP